MTIVEALKISKERGTTFRRASGGGWIRYDPKTPNWVYKFNYEDLVADDWEPAS